MAAGRKENGMRLGSKNNKNMNTQDVIAKLNTIKAGTFFTLDIERPVKLRAAFKRESITKRSTMQAQACDLSLIHI